MCKLNKRLHDDIIIAVHIYMVTSRLLTYRGGGRSTKLEKCGEGHITL